ncbi:MAG TPA: ABC transporter permease [Pyrinomonadaceae bacterium]|nr:ABC transporter permease [Pyrinomonadaceae bacterium]
MRSILQDLRYAIRMMIKRPGFATVAIFTLALGIGANSAIFSVVNAVLLRPLPFKQPDKLIKLWETYPQGFGTVSPPNLKDWREQNTAFTGIAAYQSAGASLQGSDYSERVATATVSANFFDVLGVAPRLGRAFHDGEEEPGRNRVVILSDALWQRRFAQDKSIIGQTILLNGEKHEVIGVMSPEIRFPSRLTELWVPLDLSPTLLAGRDNHFLLTLGRLKDGVSLEQAREEMVTIGKRLADQYKDSQAARSVRLIPLQEEMVQFVRPALLTLFGAVVLVLLIACVNVANLLLARGAARRREIAIRSALGAGRQRLVRQFLVESVLLAVIGGGLGLVLANWGVSALAILASSVLPRASEIGLDRRVVGFTLGLSVLTGIVFGLAPALQSSKSDVQTALKDTGNAGGSPHRNRLRAWLVVAEISAALVLLISAGLLLKTFWRLQRMDPGLKTENVITMSIALPAARYSNSQTIDTFHQQLLDRLRSLPGVQHAGMINYLPLQQFGVNGDVLIEGDPPYLPGQAPWAELRTVTTDYFSAFGIPIVAGRDLNDHDVENAASVVIVNRAFVQKYLGGKDAIGKRVLRDTTPITIVGVVADVFQSGLTQAPRPEIYFPDRQSPDGVKRTMSLVLTSLGDPNLLVSSVRGQLRELDPNQPVYNVKTMSAVVNESVSDRRLNMILLGIFASVALILATIGIYSVMSFTVTQSTREIGIRMALGARSFEVLKLVIGHGLMLTLLGVAIGIAGAFGLTRLLAGLVYGVTVTDPLIFTCVPALLVAVALLACYLPGRRAMKLDPIVTLRNE